ncbi:hypothetical protein CEXT_545951 [Caerostris extrusa]|uniref:Uncharacterized protein n=1 Tax=Caerostris extrusa TaxID=172846 RepID=A0AAV4Q3J4_CAEEX|nr:hypothetical protein CEXT_545951 [Caerostris extrusa]
MQRNGRIGEVEETRRKGEIWSNKRRWEIHSRKCGFLLEKKNAGQREGTCIKTTHPEFCWALENRNLASAYHAYRTPGQFYSGDVVTQGYVLNQRSDVSGICPAPLKYSGSNRKIFLFSIIRIQKSVP